MSRRETKLPVPLEEAVKGLGAMAMMLTYVLERLDNLEQRIERLEKRNKQHDSQDR